MTDMKRRAAALLDFISRTQVELAAETAPSPGDGKGEEAQVNGEGSGQPAARIEKTQADPVVDTKPQQNGEVSESKEFKELSCMEMMDSLTRRLVKWQQEYTA